MSTPIRHIALQFGHIKHFNEGLSEFSRQLGLQLAARAEQLREDRNWHFHFILPPQWHGMFGDHVRYHELSDGMRFKHSFPVDLDVWHGLHQHMRYRPPANSRSNLITVHDLNHQYAKTALKLWWQNVRIRRQLRGVHRIVAISEFVKHDVERYWPWAPPVTVIYNGVANLSHAAQTAVPALQSERFFFHISRMSASKNVGSLIELAAHWPERLFVLAGPQSPEVDQHRQSVSMRGLSNVRILTDITEAEKAWLYAHCDAFLFPSLMEGFGLPPIEALFFGVPVVVARRSCLPEVCGAAAHYWDTFDPAHMREVLEAATGHNAISQSTRLNQAARYQWTNCSENYLQAYRG